MERTDKGLGRNGQGDLAEMDKGTWPKWTRDLAGWTRDLAGSDFAPATGLKKKTLEFARFGKARNAAFLTDEPDRAHPPRFWRKGVHRTAGTKG
jgi:hypothetical protein